MAALDKIFELLDEEPDLVDRPGRDRARPRVRGEIEFDDVSFGYGGRGRRARRCSDISLDVPPGQTVALVGATGAGKSTFAKLVARFYDPTERRDPRRRPRPARRHRALAALADGDRAAGGLPVQRHDRRQHRLRAPGRDATRRSQRGRARVGADEFIDAPRERLRHAGRRARRRSSRPASASSSPSPARSSPTRGSSSSTRRPRTSTSTPRAAIEDGPAPPARRPHVDRHRPPPLDDPPGRAASSCSTTAGSSSRAPTTSCSRPRARYWRLYRDWAEQAAAKLPGQGLEP